MADRTVDLVIRAKNEATAVLDQITASLDAFTKGQSGLAAGAEQTGSALTRLAAGVKDIGQGLDNLKNLGRVQADIVKMGEAANKLGQDAGAAAIKANQLAGALAQVEQRNTAAAGRTKAATDAVKGQTAAVEQETRALKSLDSQIAATTARLDALDKRSAGGQRLTPNQQDNRAEDERRLRRLQELRGTQEVRLDETRSPLAGLQADQRDAAAQQSAVASQFAALRKEALAAGTAADQLAGRLDNLKREEEGLAAQAAVVGERLGLDATKANAYAEALAKLEGAQLRVNLAMERNKAAQAFGGPDTRAFDSALKNSDPNDLKNSRFGEAARMIRDQQAAVTQARREAEIASQRGAQAGAAQARDPSEANARNASVTALEADTANRTLAQAGEQLSAYRKRLSEALKGIRADAAEAAAEAVAAAEKRSNAVLAAVDKEVQAQVAAANKEREARVAAANKEREARRVADVRAAQSQRAEAQDRLDATTPTGQGAAGATAGYREVLAQLAALKSAEEAAAETLANAGKAVQPTGASYKERAAEVVAATQQEKAALDAATAAYKAQEAQVARIRELLAAAKAATLEQAAAEAKLNAALQQGAQAEALFIQAGAAAANREAATNAVQTQIAAIGRLNAAQRVAAEAAAALAAAEREEIPAALSVAEAMQRQIAAKKEVAAASRNMAEAAKAEAAALAASAEKYKTAEQQVLSFIAVYAGFSAIKAQIKDAISASVDFEAAQIRVSQAIGGSDNQGAAAFEHIVRKAQELKIGVLETANEFGKFTAAVKGTSIEGAQATRIFDAFLTISRGYKLDSESIQRGTIALRDLAATGQVSLRYLNQFDRAVPVGLLSELAKAAGFSTDRIGDFLKAVHNGQVGLETLAPALEHVANNVQDRLPAALNTAQSTLADFKNALLESQLAFSGGGFLEAIVTAVNKVNESLRSDAGKQGLRELGTIIGYVIQALGFMAEHARVVLAAMAALGAVKLVGLLNDGLSVIGVFKSYGVALAELRTAKLAAAAADAEIIAGNAAVVASEEAVAAATVTTTEAFAAFLASPLGLALALAGVVGAFVSFSGGSSNASKAGEDFNKVLDDLKTKSDEANSSIKGAAEALNKLTAADLDQSILSLRDAIKETNAELDHLVDGGLRNLRTGARIQGNTELDKELGIIREFILETQNGELSVDNFEENFNKVYAAMKDPEAIEFLQKAKKGLQDLADQTVKLATVAQATEGKSHLPGVAEDAAKASPKVKALTEDLKGQQNGMTEVQRAEEALQKALDNLGSAFPSIKSNLKELSEEAKIAAANFAAIKLDESLSKNEGMGGGIGGIGPFKSENFDATQLKIDAAKQQKLQEGFNALPGFSERISKLGKRVFGAEAGGEADPDHARSPTGALGSGQFLRSTFLEQFKKKFPDSGLTDDQIASFRTNRALSQYFEQQYLLEQGTALEKVQSKHDIGFEGRAYLGYNAGLPAATRLLQADPNSSARSAVGDTVANANPSYYGKTTVAQAIAIIKRKSGDGQELTDRGQTGSEATTDNIADLLAKRRRDLESKIEGDKGSKRDQAVEGERRAATDQILEQNKKSIDPDIRAQKELTKEEQRQVDILAKKKGEEYDSAHKDEAEKKALEELTTLEEKRKLALEGLANAQKKQDPAGIAEYKKKLAEANEEIKKAIPNAEKLAKALGDQKGLNGVEKAKIALEDIKNTSDETGKKIAEDFAGDAMSAIDGFVSDLTKGKNAMDALKNAFLKFASSFLKQIAEMILKKALLGAIGGNPDSSGKAQSGGIFGGLFGGGGGGGGGIMSLFGGLFHEGGTIGSAPEMTRRVDPAWFANAPRFHEGGFPGLKPSEVPIIAQKGEQVLSKAQVSANGRETAGAPMQQPTRNILVMGDSEVAAAMAGSHGEAVMMSHIKRNATTISKMVK